MCFYYPISLCHSLDALLSEAPVDLSLYLQGSELDASCSHAQGEMRKEQKELCPFSQRNTPVSSGPVAELKVVSRFE